MTSALLLQVTSLLVIIVNMEVESAVYLYDRYSCHLDHVSVLIALLFMQLLVIGSTRKLFSKLPAMFLAQH